MISRVTAQATMRTAQLNLQHSASELAKLQDRATSLKKISKPSDDPIGTADSLRIRAEQQQNQQFARNITDGSGWLTTLDSTLTASTTLMHQIRDLTVQGANDGTMSAEAKEAIAVELEGLREELLNRANTTVQVDVDGRDVFGEGATSVFAVIDSIVSDLRSGVNVNPRIAELDTHLNAMLGVHGTVGARHAQLLRAEETTMERAGSLEAQRSGIEDVDLGEVVLDLKLQEVTYQSALAVTARVLQPTLMDFLR
jgi:flagellar hook-associated protein 3 FlgL